jgi:hypothetical protein
VEYVPNVWTFVVSVLNIAAGLQRASLQAGSREKGAAREVEGEAICIMKIGKRRNPLVCYLRVWDLLIVARVCWSFLILATASSLLAAPETGERRLDVQELLRELPAAGGTVNLPPGRFLVSPAVVENPNVTIRGHGTTLIVKPAVDRPHFLDVLVSAEGFKLEAVSFEWQTGDEEGDLIRLASSRVRVLDCSFKVETADQRRGWSSVLHQLAEQGNTTSSGFWVSLCRFYLAAHVTGIRVQNMRAVYVSNNEFDGLLKGPIRGLWCQGVNYLQVLGNTFLSMSYRRMEGASTGIFIDNPGADLGHLEIVGNHFHTIFGEGSAAIRLHRHIYGTISANVFGRIQGPGNAAIELRDADATNISGNHFENLHAAALSLAGNCRGIGILNNTYNDCYQPEVRINAEGGSIRRVSVIGNQFDATTHPHKEAIVIGGDRLEDIIISGNHFFGYPADTAVNCPPGVKCRDNFFSPKSGSGSP